MRVRTLKGYVNKPFGTMVHKLENQKSNILLVNEKRYVKIDRYDICKIKFFFYIPNDRMPISY